MQIEGGAYGAGNPAYGNVQQGGPTYGPPNGGGAPFPHPVAYGQPPQQPPTDGGIPSGQLLPNGATVVAYVDRMATKLPWWFWMGAGIGLYHFVVVKPIWKSFRTKGG